MAPAGRGRGSIRGSPWAASRRSCGIWPRSTSGVGEAEMIPRWVVLHTRQPRGGRAAGLLYIRRAGTGFGRPAARLPTALDRRHPCPAPIVTITCGPRAGPASRGPFSREGGHWGAGEVAGGPRWGSSHQRHFSGRRRTLIFQGRASACGCVISLAGALMDRRPVRSPIVQRNQMRHPLVGGATENGRVPGVRGASTAFDCSRPLRWAGSLRFRSQSVT